MKSKLTKEIKLTFKVEGKPPKKSAWKGKNAKSIITLRKAALESRKKAGLKKCIAVPVKLKLTVYAPNVDNRDWKQSGDDDVRKYIGDLDSLVAGVCDYLSNVKTKPGDNNLKLSPLFDDEPEIDPTKPILINDDSQIKIIIAEKKESKNLQIHYKIEIKSIK